MELLYELMNASFHKKLKHATTKPKLYKGLCAKTTFCTEIGERQSLAFAFIPKFKN
jgi:hypothetical protein